VFVSPDFPFFFFSIYSPHWVSSCPSNVRLLLLRSVRVCCLVRRSTFVVHRSSFGFVNHRSVIIFFILLSFIICVCSSIGVDLLCSRSCFTPLLLSRSGNITILLLFIGFAAFAMFDVPVFPIFARLGCFCKDFRVGYSLPISIWCSTIFISGLYNNSY